MVSRHLSLIMLMLVASLLPGCTGSKKAPTGGDPSAVQSLLADAERAESEGRLADASATLERALRIEPRNAALWTRLGHVRLAEGDHDQAESIGIKATVLATSDRQRRDAWQLVAAARDAKGDVEGAMEARARAI